MQEFGIDPTQMGTFVVIADGRAYVRSDAAIRDQIIIACIMGESSFNDSKQDVVDALIQMGSNLPPDALMTIVTVAIKYECPELAGKLGG